MFGYQKGVARSTGDQTGQKARQGVADITLKDNDQEVAFEKIIDLLLAGGYFRARIQGLSRFDKVIGGLTWAITSSNFDIDVDLFFQENSNIGQQIHLGDQIDRALRKMKCPHPLQSYQIRGEDFVCIFPVIQWLITKVIETREERGDLLREFSVYQFSHQAVTKQTPADQEFKARLDPAKSFLTDVSERYRPLRTYRSKDRRTQDEQDRIQATLLEYGDLSGTTIRAKQTGGRARRAGGASSSTTNAASKVAAMFGGTSSMQSADAVTKEQQEQEEENKRRQAEAKKMQRMMASMNQVENPTDSSVAGGVLDTIFALDEVKSLVQDDQAHRDQWKEGGGEFSGADLQEREHNRAVHKRQEKIDEQKQLEQDFQEEHKSAEHKLQQLQATYEKQVAFNKKIESELAKLAKLETPENQKTLALLKKLVSIFEALKNQEAQFTETIAHQRSKLESMINSAKSIDPEELLSAEDKEIKRRYEELLATLASLKQRDSKIRRLIAMLKRKIDAIPSRTELQQYQQQFLELYETIARRLTETRSYYASYNTLSTQHEYLEKEVKILDSVSTNYKAAMNSKSNKQALLTQLQGIVSSIEEYLDKAEKNFTEKKQSFDQLNETYLKLVDKERKYFKAVKELEIEARKARANYLKKRKQSNQSDQAASSADQS